MNKRQILIKRLVWLCNTQSVKQSKKTAIFEQVGAILARSEAKR